MWTQKTEQTFWSSVHSGRVGGEGGSSPEESFPIPFMGHCGGFSWSVAETVPWKHSVSSGQVKQGFVPTDL